jgi:cell division inhibitor SepF
MSNPLKKTMVYLGLADEELEHEAPRPRRRPLHRSCTRGPSPAPKTGAAVTPLRKHQVPPSTPQAEMNEILTVHPRQYRDAQVIAESFREGVRSSSTSRRCRTATRVA